MAEVRIEGFQEAVDEALGDIEMAGGNEVEVVEAEEEAAGNETALEEAAAPPRTTFIECVPRTWRPCIY